MMEFIKLDIFLLLRYEPNGGTEWIYKKFEEGDYCRVKNTFIFTEDDLFDEEQYLDIVDDFDGVEEYVVFVIAELEGDYYKFKKDVLGLDVDLYMSKDITFRKRLFMAQYNKSIFRVFSKIVKEDIRIGEGINDIPISTYLDLVKNFPNRTELQKYVKARVSSTIREFIDSCIDAKARYEKYMNKYVKSIKGENVLNAFAKNEKIKYQTLLQKLKEMLDNETNYTEKQWQEEILQIILLIYPKYINVFDEVKIKDVYNNKNRYLDLLLVDSNGNVDIIEIKKPFEQSVVSRGKYRDNYVPLKELSGSIMQLEKYIFYFISFAKIIFLKVKHNIP